ncbi:MULTISPECIES: CynX/NimT family MFS transporter [unclassified Photobacterium]|uniref:CynX/NimT family MFS transporter n=1 Tax=unclassified Photobacterium TaxID=2628852 RepID=UPI000D174B95|nr:MULTISPECIES: CynX/NimT family MFS transporter [unclassified Photobacterium]PSV28611.1 MFS transporter [Photobacterium sp. GB-72]PSV53825.1 MFS transporter [Photobacterium sp. GB-1]
MSHKNKKTVPKVARPALVILGILLIASNLRAPLTGLGPILEFISQDLGLSATQAGMLTTLPLLAFALFSPVSSGLARKIGLEPSLMIALVLVGCGVLIRSGGSTLMLFLGTCIIGIGIAIGNVLLPSLLKRDFPTKVTTLTAVYVLIMGIGSTLSSSTAIPMMNLAGSMGITAIPHWAFALATVLIFPIISIIVWLPQLSGHTRPSADTADIDSHSYLWRSAAAWQVTIFLGLNSFIMYIFISWLPSILIDNGYTENQAGYLHGVLQLSTAIPALVLIPLMAKMKDKRAMSFAMAVLAFIGILGLLMMPEHALIWVICFGFSCGGGFILGLSFVGIRTHDAHQAAALSGMAQCMGYLLAATGPIIFGSLHESTHSWEAPLYMTLAVCVVWGFLALFAGRSHVIVRSQSGKDIVIDAPVHENIHEELKRVKNELALVTEERNELKKAFNAKL